jgi:hypothetical protein
MDTTIQNLILILLTNYKNENKYSDIIYLLIISSSFIPFNEIKINILNYFKKYDKKQISINIPSYEVPIIRSSSTIPITKSVYSNTFLSIVHYLSTNKDCKINSLTEIMTNNTELNSNYCYDQNDWKKKDHFMFIPINSNKFLISEKQEIFCEFREINNDDKEENNGKNNNIIIPKSKKFILTLSLNSTNEKDLIILENFVKVCLEEYNLLINIKKDNNTQYIFEYKNCEKEDNKLQLLFDEFPLQNNKDLLKNIFFEDKEKLINYIKPFVYNPNEIVNIGEEKYKRCGFTFKSGILFYGSPGCGKTSTIKAILNYTKRHAILINLGKIKTCEELQTIFRKRTINGRELNGKQLCYILEDCDAFENNIIQTRNYENEKPEYTSINKLINLTETTVKIMNKQEDNLNLSCFLNILDGIIELHGIMIIMTTNYPEKIDEALIRPGRFDFKYEFKKTTKKIIREMIQFKYELSEKEILKYDDILDIKDYVLSPAEIQSICFKNENIIDCINEIVKTSKNEIVKTSKNEIVKISKTEEIKLN